jgi:hypothetical protein
MIVDRFETHAMAIYRPYQLLAKILQGVCRASGDPARKSRSGSNGVSALVSAQHQSLDGQQQGLNPQQQRVHEAGGVDDMQPEALERTDLA